MTLAIAVVILLAFGGFLLFRPRIATAEPERDGQPANEYVRGFRDGWRSVHNSGEPPSMVPYVNSQVLGLADSAGAITQNGATMPKTPTGPKKPAPPKFTKRRSGEHWGK
jgi:hypothetical protein